MNELIPRILQLRDDVKNAEDELKELKKTLERFENLQLDIMLCEGTQSFKMLGKTFYKQIDTLASSEDKEALMEWLKENDEDYIIDERPRIHAQTLSKWVREREKEGKEIPDTVKVYLKLSLRVRKS